MYDLNSYEAFKELIEELEKKYKETEGDPVIYPDHPRIMYEEMKRYIEETYGSPENE